MNGDKRELNQKAELSLAELDAANGGVAGSVVKKQNDTSKGVIVKI